MFEQIFSNLCNLSGCLSLYYGLSSSFFCCNEPEEPSQDFKKYPTRKEDWTDLEKDWGTRDCETVGFVNWELGGF